MSPEVAGHVGVHVAEAVEGAKGQVKQEAPQKREVPPYLKLGAQQSLQVLRETAFLQAKTRFCKLTFLPPTITIVVLTLTHCLKWRFISCELLERVIIRLAAKHNSV